MLSLNDLENDLDIEAAMAEEAAAEQTPEQAAFAEIAKRAEAGLADCDEAYARIQGLLAEYDKTQQAAETDSDADSNIDSRINSKHEQLAEQADFASPCAVAEPNREALERDSFVQARLREARRAANNASWQLLLGFGISFAVRVGLLGICLGGWIDRHWLGGTGLGAAGIILLVIGYSFYMFYADLRRSDERWREERERLQAEAEADFAARSRR